MIEGIKNREQNIYTSEMFYKKTAPQKEVVYHTEQYSQAQEQDFLQQYGYEEMTSQEVRKAWQDVEEQIEDAEEKAAYLYQTGYSVEDLTLGELAYRTAKEEKTESSRVREAHYPPIEEKIDRIKEQHNGMYATAMADKEITINSLYKGSFTANSQKGINQYLKEDVTKVMGYNGIADNQGNRGVVEKLMSLGLDVSKESVVKLQNIQAAVEGLDKQDEAQKALEDIEANEEVGNRVLMEEEKILYTEKDIKDIIDDLAEVDEDNIQETVASGKDITIGNLRESLLKNTEKVLKGTAAPTKETVTEKQIGEVGVQDESYTKDPASQEKVQSIKDQIKDIRAMLNTESARKLSEKMPLESTELMKVAEELRHIAEVTIEDAIQKVELPVTEDTKHQIKQTMEAAILVGRYKEVAAGELVPGQAGDHGEAKTLENIHEALIAYEEVGTVPEKRFGETIQKLDEEVKHFLERQALPQDKVTMEASRALIANQMDLTMPHLEDMKVALEKINVIIEDLTPYEAAEFIKEGINPYKASLTHLVEWLGEKRMPKLQDTVAGAIVTLEEKGKITEEQKQSLIGMYRILGQIKSHKEEIVGYLYKNNLPLTLEKIEEAVRYGTKGQGINQQIDDDFGEIEKLDYTKPTARVMLQEAREEITKVLDVAKLLEEMELPLTKENITKLGELSTRLYPLIKQTVKEELGKHGGMDVLPQSVKEKVEAIKRFQPEMLEVMEKHRIPLTLSNMYWIQKLSEEPKLYEELLQKHELTKKGFPESFEEVEEDLQHLQEEVVTRKEQSMQEGDMKGYKHFKQLEEVVAVQRQLVNKEGLYQIPFVIQSETRLVNLYIQERNAKSKEASEETRAIISYHTPHLGEVKAHLTLKDDKITYQVVGETKEATQLMKEEKNVIQDILEGIGYQVEQGAYETHTAAKETMVARVFKDESQFEITV
ncbi:MAG: DUF6240 domain-containing protein [Cellulosilyticaceae bacterium]